MDKSNFENTDGICECKNLYSIYPHGDGHALMFAACPHRHGYNLANIQEPDLPMLRTMTDRLNGYADHRAVEEELAKAKADIREMVNKAADQHLEGYRELGRKAADAENARDKLTAEVAGWKKIHEADLADNQKICRTVEGLRGELASLKSNLSKSSLDLEKENAGLKAEVKGLREALKAIEQRANERHSEKETT